MPKPRNRYTAEFKKRVVLAAVTVGSFASEQKSMPCGMVGSLERNIHAALMRVFIRGCCIICHLLIAHWAGRLAISIPICLKPHQAVSALGGIPFS